MSTQGSLVIALLVSGLLTPMHYGWAEYIEGKPEEDNLKATSTADNILGQGGSDVLDGNDGNDEIAGNEGDGIANEITIASFVHSKT